MPQIWDTLNLTFWNHVLFIMPATMAQWVWQPPTPLPELAPTVWEFVWQQAASLVIFDFQYFVWHVTHHKVRGRGRGQIDREERRGERPRERERERQTDRQTGRQTE